MTHDDQEQIDYLTRYANDDAFRREEKRALRGFIIAITLIGLAVIGLVFAVFYSLLDMIL
jgi:hypothetical protein